MSRARSSHACGSTLWLAIGLVAASGCLAMADEVSRPHAEARDEIVFVPVLVPKERLRDVVPPGHVPIKRDEFRRMLAELQPGAEASVSRARIHDAHYTARLDKQQLVGRAQLQITHEAAAAVLLPLHPLRLDLRRARWREDASPLDTAVAASETTHPAIVGTLADGRTMVMVERSATLEADWSLRGVVGSSGETVFEFALPLARTTRLTLDLPRGLRPVVEGGVVERLDDDVVGAVSDPAARELGTLGVRWRVSVARTRGLQLRIVPEQVASHRLVLLRQQSTNYEFTPAGVAVTAELRLAIHDASLERLRFSLDRALELTGVKFRDDDLVWVEQAEGTDGRRQFVVQLPSPISGNDQVIRVAAFAPIVLDVPWRLPILKLLDVNWLEGRSTLSLAESLTLTQLATRRSRETRDELTVGSASRVRMLQHYDPDDAPEIVVSRRQPEIQVTVGTTIGTISRAEGTPTAKAVVQAQCASRWGDRFSMDASLSDVWEIESLDSDPPGAVEDFQVVATTQARRQRALHVRLSKAITPQQPLRLRLELVRRDRLGVVTRDPAPAGTELARSEPFLTGDELPPVDFGPSARQYVALAAEPQTSFTMRGASDPRRIAPADLPPPDQSLLDLTGPRQLFLIDDATRSVQVLFNRESPRYMARVFVDVLVDEGKVTELYRIRCQPTLGAVEKMSLQFSETREEPLEWRLVEEDEQPLPLGTRRRAEPVGDRGETWDISLPAGRSEEFELEALRTTDFVPGMSISLAGLLDAEAQSGAALVRSAGGWDVRVEMPDRGSLARPSDGASSGSTVLASCRYEPATPSELKLWPSLPLAEVWKLRVISRIGARGRTTHDTYFHLENHGRPQVVVTVPRGVQLDFVEVENQRHSLRMQPQRRVAIPLPRGVSYPTIRVGCSTSDSALGVVGAIAPPGLSIDVPVLESRWFAVLPPGYAEWPDVVASMSAAPRSGAAMSAAPFWARRLFGPILRSSWDSAPAASDDEHDPRDRSDVDSRASGSEDRGEPSQVPPTSLVSVPPWRVTSDARERGRERPGCQLIERGVTGEAEFSCHVVRRSALRALGWSGFLVSAALVLVVGRPRSARGRDAGVSSASRAGAWASGSVLLIIASTACVALLVSEAWTSVASPVFLGSLVAGWMLLVWRPTDAEPDGSLRALLAGPPRNSTWPRGVAGGLLVLATLALPLRAADAPGSRRPRIRDVITPVDEHGEPAGEHDYIPLQFYEELHRRWQAVQGSPRGCLVTSAEYECSIERFNREATIREFEVRYRLKVLSEPARLRIPLDPAVAQLVEARVDNEPIELGQRDSELLIELTADAEELRLSFRPVVRTQGDVKAVELPIVPCADAVLHVGGASMEVGVDVPGALGAIETDEFRGTRVRLGTTHRLTIHWSGQPRATAEQATADVDQLAWISIRPGSVVVDARWNYTVHAGRVSAVKLDAGPRLRVVRLADENGPIRLPPRSESSILEVPLPEPKTDHFSLRATFLVIAETSGVGNFVPPRLEAITGTVRQRSLAVSVAPELELDVENDPQFRPLDVDEFVSAWNEETPTKPTHAYRVSDPDAPWSLFTRFKQPVASVRQQLDLRVADATTQVSFDAELRVVGGSLLQHQVRVPTEFQADRVRVVAESGEVPLSWSAIPRSLSAEAKLNLFLNRPVTGAYRLTIEGHLPTILGAVQPIPVLRVEQASLEMHRVRVFRRESVQVRLTQETERLSGGGAVGGYHEGLGRHVATIDADPSQPISLESLGGYEVQPNRPRTVGELVIRVYRAEDTWMADAEYQATVTDGVLDAIRFQVPEQWTGPFVCEPAMRQELVTLPAGGGRLLVLRPSQPTRGEVAVRIRGRLSFGLGQRELTPDIMPLDVHELRRFLVLPTRFEQQELPWQATGLLAVESPSQALVGADPSVTVFEIIRGRFRASVQELDQVPGVARVLLADLHLVVRDRARMHGVITWDIDPAGRQECHLRLPGPEFEIVRASVAGLPARMEPVAKTEWRLEFGPRLLPQRVEVVYRGPLVPTATASVFELAAPRLVDLPVERRLVTLRSAGRLAERPGTSLASRWRLDERRIRFMTGLVENASALMAESPAEDRLPWFRAWHQRYAALRSRKLRFEQPGSEFHGLIKELDQRWEAVRERIGVGPISEDARPRLTAGTTAPELLELDEESLHEQFLETQGQLDTSGDAEPILVVLSSQTPRLAMSQLVAVLVVIVLACCGCVISARRIVPAVVLQSPALPGVLIGLAWWLWFAPSPLGWLIIAISLAGLMQLPGRAVAT